MFHSKKCSDAANFAVKSVVKVQKFAVKSAKLYYNTYISESGG